jgi:hypothetical protein
MLMVPNPFQNKVNPLQKAVGMAYFGCPEVDPPENPGPENSLGGKIPASLISPWR